MCGIASFLPGLSGYFVQKTGGTGSARYCYSVWLRHIVMAKKSGLNFFPKVVAELGPGDSLGIGLAALISGSDRYLAFDIVEHTNAERNELIFDDLVQLFRNREPIPAENEFPELKPYLEKYDFPDDILDNSRLQHALKNSRLEKIRKSIISHTVINPSIQYKVPWNAETMLEKESVDMIYSQAVLEHVDDLQNTYKHMYKWLKKCGFMSHQIDFKCHGTANEWNGHWAYSDLMWKLIRGRQPYLINREPYSKHMQILGNKGFTIICEKKIRAESNLLIEELAPKFRSISMDDLTTSGVFVQSKK